MATGAYVLYNGTVYAELLDVTEPTISIEKVPTTTHDDGGVASRIPGETEHGDLKFRVNFVNDTAQAALRALAIAKTVGTWQIVYPLASFTLGYEIPGFVSNLTKSLPQKGSPATWDITISPSNSVTERTTAATGTTTPFLSIADDGDHALTLTPSAANAVYEYDCQSYTDSVHLHITATATTGTIYVDGVVTGTGVASAAITHSSTTYSAGKIHTIFVVVTESGKIPKIYKIRVTRGITASP
jgi:hypothetical protein